MSAGTVLAQGAKLGGKSAVKKIAGDTLIDFFKNIDLKLQLL